MVFYFLGLNEKKKKGAYAIGGTGPESKLQILPARYH